MIKSTLKIARYCPLVFQSFSNFLGLFPSDYGKPCHMRFVFILWPCFLGGGWDLGGSEPQADAIREAEHAAAAAAAAAKGGAPSAASLGEKFQSFGRGRIQGCNQGPSKPKPWGSEDH